MPTEVVLFHHIQGVTPGVLAFADELRAGGNRVHTPDLFDSRIFSTLDEGIEYAESIGFGTILDRGVAAGEKLGGGMVYAGFSMGVMPAQKLAQTRTDVQGALFFSSCLPVAEFGDGWPDGVPVQIHGMESDPIFTGEGDLDAARALVDSTDHAELFLYPGEEHLFTDSSLPSYDQAAADLVTARVLEFLETTR